ncbi:MAG: acyltransferase family protein [Methyloligellaceae bacterium]
MFGSLRFVLALAVVITHLWAGLTHWAGVYAVFGFFVLSGYLMTTVLRNTYGFSPAGIGHYLANRGLRIFPVYWCVLVLSLCAVALAPKGNGDFLIAVPANAETWIKNLVIFGLDSGSAKIIQPAWTLYTEFVFYIAMGLLLSRWKSVILLWVLLSLAYTIYLIAAPHEFEQRYYAILPATMPFALGALLAAFSRDRTWRTPRWAIYGVVLVFCVHLFQADRIWGNDGVFHEGFYVSLPLAVLAVLVLGDLHLEGRARKVDKILGDLSYPIFLVHWMVGSVMAATFGLKSGPGLLLASLPGILLISYLLHRIVETPINRLRNDIRRHGIEGHAPMRTLWRRT